MQAEGKFKSRGIVPRIETKGSEHWLVAEHNGAKAQVKIDDPGQAAQDNAKYDLWSQLATALAESDS